MIRNLCPSVLTSYLLHLLELKNFLQSVYSLLYCHYDSEPYLRNETNSNNGRDILLPRH
jgi:hypothetical protein